MTKNNVSATVSEKEGQDTAIRWAPLVFRYLLPILLLLWGSIKLVHYVQQKAEETVISESIGSTMDAAEGRKQMVYRGSYKRDFNDLNDVQLAVAQKIGIEPAKNRKELIEREKIMSEVKTNPYYVVDKLTHSVPYLIPEAKLLLDEIGERFQKELLRLGQKPFRLIVTSLTRSSKDVSQLTKRNVNASSNSTHCYGTTFDISWVRYAGPEKSPGKSLQSEKLSDAKLKAVLAQVLKHMKDDGACFVKHERRQACFHITLRKL